MYNNDLEGQIEIVMEVTVMKMLLEKAYVFLDGIFFYFAVPSGDIVRSAFSRGLTVFSDIISYFNSNFFRIQQI